MVGVVWKIWTCKRGIFSSKRGDTNSNHSSLQGWPSQSHGELSVIQLHQKHVCRHSSVASSESSFVMRMMVVVMMMMMMMIIIIICHGSGLDRPVSVSSWSFWDNSKYFTFSKPASQPKATLSLVDNSQVVETVHLYKQKPLVCSSRL